MRSAFAMIHIRHEQHVEVLVRIHQRIGKADGFNRMHVVINVAVLNQKMPLQTRSAMVTFDWAA